MIIAAFINAHPRHENSLHWLQRVKKKEIEGIISVHSLIESYSILTTLPLSPKIYPSLAINLIKENILKNFVVVKYNTDDYSKLLDELSSSNIIGGASYNGLILYAARKMNIERILILNVNDFLKISPQLAKIISEP
ncbi:MAG: VapC toxin family PIN domain ribonuclease [Actinomycetota bacterium]